jgi:hypothetical protein
MTIVERKEAEDSELRLGEILGHEPGAPIASTLDAAGPAEDEVLAGPEVNPVIVAISCFLASAAAGWVMAGIFSGLLPRFVGVLGAAIGAGTVVLSYRTRRPGFVQFLVVPISLAVGALLILADATGGNANLFGLVLEALRSGGLGSPPVPFDPGWRVLLVLVAAVLGSASASLAVGYSKPRLGVMLAVPLIVGGILMQPPGAVTVSAVVALVLGIAALAVSFGAELAREGATSGRFEARRLGRGVGILGGLVVLLAALTQVGFLFPEPKDTRVIPPKRPQTPPAEPDRELFRVKTDRPLPWRLGVLDVYGLEEQAWLTPPYDPKRFVTPPASAAIPRGLPEDVPLPQGTPTFSATFTLSDVRGHVIPDVQGTVKVAGEGIEYDPRTQTLRLQDRARKGATYTVEAMVPPEAAVLNAAPTPREAMRPYLQTPKAPQEVEDLLALAPTGGLYERLQYVRTQFYSHVVAAGAGNPVDVPPSRVADMLAGKEATPYEITAGEALLARWAGVPARIGYGYFGGDAGAPGSGELSLRPKHGATWLEAYFEGQGWVPIVGRPPKAKSSTANRERNHDPTIRPTDQLALQVYVPLRQPGIQLVYTLVRFWMSRVLVMVVLGVLALFSYAGVLKAIRSRLRRRWAVAHGPRSRVAVAYAELRDVANDFGFGHPTLTPLQMLDAFQPDKELRELSWLVERGLWGDLVRDLRDEEADAAEAMSQSVVKRLTRAQSPLLRVLRFASRVSLRDPYADDIPNLWPRTSPFRRLPSLRRLRRRPAAATTAAALLVVMALLAAGCAQQLDFTTPAPMSADATPPVPDALGGYRLVREPAADAAYGTLDKVSIVSHGRVYSVRDGDDVEASLQIAWFKPGLKDRSTQVRRSVLKHLENGAFQLVRLNEERVYVQRLPEQTMYLWYPPDVSYYVLMVARLGFDAGPLFVSLLAFQRGEQTPVRTATQVRPADPIRGAG